MIRIRVPATSANLGPGFDCLGLALSLHNRFEAEESDQLLVEGCPPELSGSDNLFVRAARRAYEELGIPFPGIHVRIAADIPIARGLGSSASCIAGGLVAGSFLAGRLSAGPIDTTMRRTASAGALPMDRLLDLAAEIEGHPDNTTPALLGGFAVSVLEGKRVRAIHASLGQDLAFRALVPPFPLETAKARAALPATLVYADAVFNVGHAALVASAFVSRDRKILRDACSDRLHEPYRAPLIPGFEDVVAAAREAGALAVFLSGAGPTVMALTEASDDHFPRVMKDFLRNLRPAPWRIYDLSADDDGAVVES